jgi:hypothetical protein
MTMFYAHLSRDLHPSAIMQKTAMNVFNWTERMNRGYAIYGDYPGLVEEYFSFDALPESLLAFLRYIFRDCGPELQATVDNYNEYIEKSSLSPGSELEAFGTPRSAHPMFGCVNDQLRGRPVVKLAMVDTVYQYQYVTKTFESLEPRDRENFAALLQTVGGEWILAKRAKRPIKYDNYTYTVT